MQKKGQVTLFVIIAIVIVLAIILVVAFRGKLFPQSVESEFAGVYDSFDSCIEVKTRDALNIAGAQGGYIEVPEFRAGSEYAPFSSQLDFFGTPVPYWYYVSSNNIVDDSQRPRLSEIENQIEEYLEFELRTCDFSENRQAGVIIESDVPRVDVEISDIKVDVQVDMDLNVEKLDSKETKSVHEVEFVSKFGKFYDIARNIYSVEQQQMFLEEYAIDVMYNYAPVTGVEFTCSPLSWNPQEVVEDIRNGLSANIGSLRASESNYDLLDDTRKYFVVDIDSDGEDVSFMYSSDWPTRVEVWPVDNGLMYAEPVGLDEGMGIMGFCYVPYHFVYDIYFPVLIQIYDEGELFQFPVSVVIDKSVPRESLDASSEINDESINEFCNYKNTQMQVYTFDPELNPVEADISYTCINQKCNMGRTEKKGGDAVLSTDFPQCIDGRVLARAEGYADSSVYISTNEEDRIDIIMNKLYELDLELYVGSGEFDEGVALINFESNENNFAVLYPEQDIVKLSEGEYNISVQVFGDTSVSVPASSSRQCVESPSPGILGVFGQTEEQCFDIDVPAQTIDNGLIAGGKTSEFILESELQENDKIELSVDSLPSPSSLEQLQENYGLVETRGLGIRFS